MGKKTLLKLFPLCLLTALLAVSPLFFKAFPLRYPSLIYENSQKYGLSPELVCAVINTESHFDENAASHAGAKGLMQLMKPTADEAAEKIGYENYSYDNITDPALNIELGCSVLKSLINKYDGNLETALCAYNAGCGNVDKWLAEEGENSLEKIPFSETDAYITTVKRHTLCYRFILAIIGGKYEA